jgi:uncharacterized membrane protein/uncharacterized RDD family membrane protein YckC
MVGPVPLSFDIASVAVSTAIPGIVWAALFVLAWKRPAFADSLGLGRPVFWLLLPGALLASFAILPVAPVSNDILAVSFAGAVFPLGVAVLAFGRVGRPAGHVVARLFGPLAAETAVLLLLVVVGDRGGLDPLSRAVGIGVWPLEVALVAAVAAAGCLIVALDARRASDDGSAAIAGTFALTTAVLVLTFVGSSAIPGVGIAETFPYFLLPPVGAGVAAALLAPRMLPGREALALPVAFVASGWGVVLGADILWQPPLYGVGPPGLYAIGGAGVLDLVYLSGLIGLACAWGAHRVLGRSDAPVGGPPAAAPPSPTALVREAYAQGLEGQLDASLATSAAAARSAGFQARRLVGDRAAVGDRPWDGVRVPGWVVSDTANLESVARAGTKDPQEAVRAWLTARALVQIGEAISGSRFATIGQRVAAFAIDSAVLGAAGAAVFALVAVVTPGGLLAVIGSIGFSAAAYGFVAAALVYFAAAEAWSGATVGKRLVGIEVRDRSLGRVGAVGALVRNAPLLPVMTLYSIGLSLAVAIALRGYSSGANVAPLGISVAAIALIGIALFVAVGVALTGVVGLLVIRLTAERQRIGDLWAGTWVVRRPTAPAAPAARLPTPAPEGGRSA